MDTGFTQGDDRPGEVFTIFSMTSLMEKSVKNNRACSQDDTLQVLSKKLIGLLIRVN
jgi:hypothetical protein